MIESPCNKICITNDDGTCLGCGRNLDEIAKWICFSDAEKNECLKKSKKRLEDLGKNSN